jgi:sulfite reductase (NADPH) flavoprotein alpha-component
VCGRSGFASTVVETLSLVFQRFIEVERPSGYGVLRRCCDVFREKSPLVFELHTDAGPIADESRWISVSEVAQRNNPKNGYWLIIDRVVYDLTEFAGSPGESSHRARYAGIDAERTGTRARAPARRRCMREMYRIGRGRPLSFEAFAAVVNGQPNGAARISCRAVYQAWVRALHLVVEMQNAHRADLSLQDSVTSPVEAQHVAGPYKQSRAAETHQRFLRNYLKPLRGETLPALWSLTRGVFAPDQGESWMQERLRHISRDQRSKYVKAISAELAEDVRAWQERQAQLASALTAARDEDTRLLKELKNALLHGIANVFEMFETAARTGAQGPDCEL